jgi:hypothetical protein
MTIYILYQDNLTKSTHFIEIYSENSLMFSRYYKNLHTLWQGILLIKRNSVEIVEDFFLNCGNLSLFLYILCYLKEYKPDIERFERNLCNCDQLLFQISR